jgi:hypothetical protein
LLVGGGAGGEVVEGVGGDEGVGLGVEVVGDEVGARASDGAPGDVDAGHVRGPAERRSEREAAGVGEQVEDAAAAADLADERPVLALVEEQPGLLAAADVDQKAHAVLADEDVLGRVVAGEHGCGRVVAVARSCL